MMSRTMGSWRLAVFVSLQRLARVLELGARALVCLGAGALRRDQLNRALTERWQEYGTDEATALSGLMLWEREFYDRFLKPDDEILVVGCGTGRDLIAFLQAGYRAHGLEPASRAAASARMTLARLGLSARITVGRIETTAIDQPFDVYVFSCYCYSYIPQRATRVAVLRAVAERLKPGGRILLCCVTCNRPPHPLPRALTRGVAWLTRAGWRSEPTDMIWPGAPGLHFEHQFGPGEIEEEAHAAGLRVVFQDRGQGLAALMRAEGWGHPTGADG